MCGIAGIIGIPFSYGINNLQTMLQLLSHRGPDDKGIYVDEENNISLGMQRLSIIDLEKGKQPMSNEDGNIWVVCNGEIYNSPQLRQLLLGKGHIFMTNNSDVEVLVHLYEEKGIDMIYELNGMYAFVIYDRIKQILFCVRDRIGIKPLYYSYKNGKFAFASELKSLLVLPWISKDINFDSLYHYISLQFIPPPETIIEDIQKLPAGNFSIFNIKNKELKIREYWELNVNSYDEKKDINEWADLIRTKLTEAVNRWTLSDVPIACSLSGGLDSSTIVGILASRGERVRTYSLGFIGEGEDFYNELPLAKKVAQKWETHHHEVVLNPKEVIQDLENMVWYLDEPYAGGLPSWYIYKIVGRDVKVCFTGTGGDELFSNYGKYVIFERNRIYKFLRMVKQVIKFRNLYEIKDYFKYPIGYFCHKYLSDSAKKEIVFNHKYEYRIETQALLENIWRESKSINPRNAVAYVDFRLQLPEEFLLVTDRFSMAHSVEARTPFLDHELVELVFRVPPHIRTGWSKPKSFFKNIVKDLLPSELLNAPKKGFILPLEKWTRLDLRPLIEDLLSKSYLKRQGIFSSRLYDIIIKPHLQQKRDYTQQVWTLFMFQMWYKRFID